MAQLPYRSAQVYTGKTWYIAFYVTSPHSGRLERVRIKFNRIKHLPTRRKEAKEMCRQINMQLARGWNPLEDQLAAKSGTPFLKAFDHFLHEKQNLLLEGSIRPDSIRAYKSYRSMIEKHLPGAQYASSAGVTKNMILQFLDYFYYEKNRSARTRNNYLSFLKNLFAWLVDNGYAYVNPTDKIRKLPEAPKKRQIIPQSTLAKIWRHLSQENFGFYILCRVEYYLFIRRTELAKLKCSAFNLDRGIVTIPADVSKNKKDDSVTIPSALLPELEEYLQFCSSSAFLQKSDAYFTGPQFKPSKTPLAPKKISDEWAKTRKAMQLPAVYQFYSLKDSGITAMLSSGIPTIIVRDQARHYDVAQTDTYAAKAKGVSSEILQFE